MSQSVSSLKQAAQSLTAAQQPWSVFLDPTSVNLPSSVSDATTRISQNLAHFRANYAAVVFLILFFSLIFHPLTLIASVLLLIAWVYLYFSRDDSLVVLGYQVNDAVVLVGLGLATLVVLVWSGVWTNIIGAVGIGVVLVLLHAVLRSTDDLVGDDIEATPYGNLLDDENDGPRGSYSGI